LTFRSIALLAIDILFMEGISGSGSECDSECDSECGSDCCSEAVDDTAAMVANNAKDFKILGFLEPPFCPFLCRLVFPIPI
jgi:hypothetical protein